MGCTGSSWGTWGSLSLHGVHGIFMYLMGFLWSVQGSLVLHGMHWVSMEHMVVPGSLWGTRGLHGAHGLPVSSMDTRTPGSPWDTRGGSAAWSGVKPPSCGPPWPHPDVRCGRPTSGRAVALNTGCSVCSQRPAPMTNADNPQPCHSV